LNAFVGGGENNTASAVGSTVSGGLDNTAGDNTVVARYSTVGGGKSNTAGGYHSTVGGGGSNTASGSWATVGGGFNNSASGGGATVGGGQSNTASGANSFAAGRYANASHGNSFVWGDSGGGSSIGINTFNVHASGGIYLNGVEAHSSDRNKKKDFSFVSAREILDKVIELPIQTWRFKTEEDSISHIGPMAQDFMAAFGYGLDERYLSTLDMDGVTLAAVQGLYELHREKDAKLEEQAEVNTALRWHNAQLQAILRSRDDALDARLRRLEKAILRESEREATVTD